jgi:hypothetical protein
MAEEQQVWHQTQSFEEDIMTTIKNSKLKHPVLTYYVLHSPSHGVAHSKSSAVLPEYWALWSNNRNSFPVCAPGYGHRFKRSRHPVDRPCLVYGKDGFRGILCRLVMWRVGIRWYAAALLIAPLLMTADGLCALVSLPGVPA